MLKIYKIIEDLKSKYKSDIVFDTRLIKKNDIFVGLKTKKIGVGDVVIVKANGSVDMVKRVTSIEGEKITVSGDNKNLESSLCFVSYKKKDVEAKMLFCFPSIKSRLFFKKV